VRCATTNPCAPTARRISYVGEIRLHHEPDARKVTVTAHIKVEMFPAFELCASLNGGPPVRMIQCYPEADVAPETTDTLVLDNPNPDVVLQPADRDVIIFLP
jgi:IstB-like ATP binding protein